MNGDMVPLQDHTQRFDVHVEGSRRCHLLATALASLRNTSGSAMRFVPLRYALLKAPSVFAGRDSQNAPEGTAHGVAISEAAGRCHRFEARIALLQTSPRRFQAQALDELRWGHVHLGAKQAREVARAHAHSRRERSDRKIVAQMLHRPCSQFAKRSTIAGLQSERSAELRLVTRTPQKSSQSSATSLTL